MAQQEVLKIVDGPDEKGLFDSLLPHHGALVGTSMPMIRLPITFEVERQDGQRIKLVIKVNSIQWEDGSGNSWNVGGHAVCLEQDGQIVHVSDSVKLYYSTKRRRGCLNEYPSL